VSVLPLPEGTLAAGVVVPTRGRPRLLERCLDALAAQDLPPEEYEVVVVDDGPDAETAAVVAARPGVRYLCTPGGRGPATARNIGWRSLHAPVVAFTDDDCTPAPQWLRAGLAALEGGLDAAAGRTIVPLPADRPTDFERNAALLDGTHFVTANAFCRRELLEALGGFDERFRMAWREDADLELSALEHGYALGTASAAVVVHPLRRATWGVSLRQQNNTMFNALLRGKHPQI
jgi:GT2 family glycosyltransferase